MIDIKMIEENGTLKPELLSAIKLCLVAEAKVQLIKPISEKAFEEAIDKFKPVVVGFEDKEANRALSDRIGKPINNSRELYLCGDEVFKDISKYHKNELAKHGYTASGDKCALLVAESEYREANRMLIDVLEPITGLSNLDLILVKDQKKYLELSKRMLITYCSEKGIDITG